MLTEERHQKILQLLDQKSVVKSQELANLFNASESTIRRDLQELEDANLLERIHGGAKRILNLGFEHDGKINQKHARKAKDCFFSR